MQLNTAQHQVILVNDQDEALGAMDKFEAHRQNALHRASSVFLFKMVKNDWKLLMQQRSQSKIVGAYQWANTICGNVRPGESYQECACRRLAAEIGVFEVTIEPICKLHYQTYCNSEYSEHEMVQVFAGWYDGLISLNPQEVSENQWVSWQHLLDVGYDRHFPDLELAPWFVEYLSRKELRDSVNNFLSQKVS